MNPKPTIILIASLLCATTAAAQQGELKRMKTTTPFYVRAGAGYGFVHAGSTEINGAGISGSESQSGNTYSREVKRVSFGSGANASVAGGYMFTRNLGLELGVHAVVAPTEHSFSGFVPGFGTARMYTVTSSAKLPVYLIPALVFTTGNKLQAYSRVGIVVPVADKLKLKETRSGAAPQTTEVFTAELTNRFSLGLQGALGLGYKLSNQLTVWGEANAISRSAYAKRWELTAYTENGLDALGSYSTNQKVTEYEFSYDATFPPVATEPSKQSTFTLPFGSIGLGLGVRYAF